MISPRFIAIFPLLLVAPALVRAQSEPTLNDSSRSTLRVITSAIVAFASDDSVAAGDYTFKNKGSPDATMDLYKLVGEFPVASREEPFVPLLEISPSFLKVEQDFPEGDSVSVDSWGMGVGAGLEMKLLDDALKVTPRLKIDYGSVEYDFSGDRINGDQLSQLVPDIQTWTYLPSIEVVWDQKIGNSGSALQLSSRGTYVYVDASAPNGNLADFSDESVVWRNRVAYEHPLHAGESLGDLFLRSSFSRIDVRGAARDGLELDNFYEVGLDCFSRTLATTYLREVGFGATYVYEDEIQGWRFGVIGRLS